MDYAEFKVKLGKLTTPDGELKTHLIDGLDSIHYVGVMGEIRKDKYHFFEPVPDNVLLCLELISLLESRGAKRDEDYIVGVSVYSESIRIGIHTTHDFLSDEDFDMNIKRYYIK